MNLVSNDPPLYISNAIHWLQAAGSIQFNSVQFNSIQFNSIQFSSIKKKTPKQYNT